MWDLSQEYDYRFDAGSAAKRAEIVAALDPQLCRCGAHPRILRAVERAANGMPR